MAEETKKEEKKEELKQENKPESKPAEKKMSCGLNMAIAITRIMRRNMRKIPIIRKVCPFFISKMDPATLVLLKNPTYWNAENIALDEIEIQLREVFNLRGTSEEARRQLHARATPLNGYATDRTLTLFVREASHLDGRDWRENLTRVVNGGTPPHQWHDADVVTFQIRLLQLASDFVRIEELVAEQRLTGATQILRIGLLDGHVQEAREVIAITPECAPVVESLVLK